jgi:hypothetical protein
MLKPLDDYRLTDVWRTTVSQRHVLQLPSDEKRTYKKWKRATFIACGAVAIITLMLSIAMSPNERTSTSKSEKYSSIVPGR